MGFTTTMLSHCEQYSDARQHRSVNEKSSTIQMIPFTHELALNLKREKTVTVYFDFSNAFDSISHS